MNADLQDMLRISRTVGASPRWVQGGGGNTSVKTDGRRTMYVKASGTALGDMVEGRGYRLVDVVRCAAIAEDEALAALDAAEREARVVDRLLDACLDDLHGRPSVETSLHAMLDRCVVHTHPSVVNGLLCARDGRAAIERMFADLVPPPLYIDYAGAGHSLACRLRDELHRYAAEHSRAPEVIFLENHGLVVSTTDADRALELTARVFDRVDRAATEAIAAAGLPPARPADPEVVDALVAEVTAAMRPFYARAFGGPALLRFSDAPVVRGFLRLPQAAELSEAPPLVPDQVVYCRERPLWIALPPDPGEARRVVAERLEETSSWSEHPLCILVDGLGLFCAAPTSRFLDAVCATMEAVLESLTIASRFGGPRGLSEEALAFLHDWEVERFRRQTASGERGGSDLAGRVVVVTGAGSGIGRGLSLFLARRGAHVVLADVDRGGAEETQRRAVAQEGAGTARPMDVDVTDEASVRALFRQIVCALGGVDVLINGAGLAPVHALVDFPLAQWRKTLDVNLTGYFLMAREAARRMIAQGTGGAIINVSSKTGLEASRNHSAYNATKSAEIHLARGWALELAEHGIRVNALCPGNVFAESKIWNEDYVKALAEKRGLRPEEVIPYYINLTALKQEVTWDDLGEAVSFLAGDRAARITGQTLVVDAGQVFVR
ncbi:MAG: SDR family oxidoreductase [Candidatus Brocadiaceae bacterium]|nr:SDR family oxidoreductase [Candidatus Brocadiaceae bacterium]